MSTNEIFPPNGPDNKMSLPVEGTVVSGDPVVVGTICGVAQTTKEATDGAATGVVNSNAPGNVTVWNGGVWRLPVTLAADAAIGDVVYATLTAGASKVALSDDDATEGNVPFGVLYEASASGADLPLGVRVFKYAGEAVAAAV